MLEEVRKAAFGLRKNKAKDTSVDPEEEEEELDENNLPVLSEEWETWYPQEWIGWCMYGTPSEKPSEFWAHQPVSNGPTDVESYYTDDKGKRKIKKPHGRVMQRDKADKENSATKTAVDQNTLMSHHLLQVEQELKLSVSAHDLQLIQLLQKNAKTAEDQEFSEWCMQEHLEGEKDALRERLLKNKNLREQKLLTSTSVRSTPTLPTTSNLGRAILPDIGTTDLAVIDENIYEDEETLFEYTPLERMYNTVLSQSYSSEIQPHASYSGQFSPSQPFSESQVVPDFDATAITEVYEEESATSQFSHGSQTTNSSSSCLTKPASSFVVLSNGNRRMSGQSRPPLPPRIQPPVLALQKSRKYVTRSSPVVSRESKNNPYIGMSWEDINEKLHKTYPIMISNPGVISTENFNISAAVQDVIFLVELKKNEVDEDPDLYMIGLWVQKIKNAIKSANINKDAQIHDSDFEDV